jgi:hypothetical protein
LDVEAEAKAAAAALKAAELKALNQSSNDFPDGTVDGHYVEVTSEPLDIKVSADTSIKVEEQSKSESAVDTMDQTLEGDGVTF